MIRLCASVQNNIKNKLPFYWHFDNMFEVYSDETNQLCPHFGVVGHQFLEFVDGEAEFEPHRAEMHIWNECEHYKLSTS